jgi:hypothetical protein
MTEPRCLIEAYQSGVLFRAHFVGSAKWFRRQSRTPAACHGLAGVRRPRSADLTTRKSRLTSGLARVVEELPAAVLRFSLQSASAVRQDFGFSGRVLSKIPINIPPTVDPLVWAEFER